MWHPGDLILLRNVHRGRVWSAMTVRVVRDAPDLVALYWTIGYPRKAAASARDRFREIWLTNADFSPVDAFWDSTEVLCLAKPGAAHACWLVRWAESGELRGWYVNLQAPLTRTRLGFDTMDHDLDLIIRADSSWLWKDEAELAEDVEHGIFSKEEAIAIRREGEAVLQTALSGGSPFTDGWEKWCPDPGWEVPAIPENWDALGWKPPESGR
jgi:hypothetical protein